MKKLLVIWLISASLLLWGCFKEEINPDVKMEIKENIQTWVTQTWNVEINKPVDINSWVILNNEMRLEDVNNLIKTIDNENISFNEKNYIRTNPLDLLKENKKDLISLFNILWVPELIELPIFWWNKEISTSICEKIINNKDIYIPYTWFEKWDCQYQKNVFVLKLDNNHIFFWINSGEWLWPTWILSIIYNINTKKVVSPKNQLNEKILSFKNKIYFINSVSSEIISIYDLEKDILLNNVAFNKSNKWQIEINDWNLLITNFESNNKINLWKIDTNTWWSNYLLWTWKYLETNSTNTKFAYLENIKETWIDDKMIWTLKYWDIENDLWKNIKKIEINWWIMWAMCFASANGTFIVKDNLIISSWKWCPLFFDTFVFDMNTWKFLYK